MAQNPILETNSKIFWRLIFSKISQRHFILDALKANLV